MARGSNFLSVDVKGRMSIPTKLRGDLIGEAGGGLIVTISPTDRCLLMYCEMDWLRVQEKLSSLPSLNDKARQLKRILIGHADDCSMDNSGRILLAQHLREFAGIDKKAVLVGTGDNFEIWQEELWLEQRESMLEHRLDEADLPPELISLSF